MAEKKQALQPAQGTDLAAAQSSRGSKFIARARESLSYYGTLAASLSVLLLIWYFAAHAVNNPYIFPFVENVIGGIVRSFMDMNLWRNLALTMRRVTMGVYYGALIGFPLGIAMGFSPPIMYTIAPFVNSLRQIPTMCWVPLAIVWFGLGDGPTIFIIAFQAVFNMILATVSAVRDIDADYYNAVRSMGAGTMGVLTDVVVPASTAGLITGMRVSIGTAWGAVV